MPDLKYKIVQNEFENRLLELGLSYNRCDNDVYTLSCKRGSGINIIVQLNSSLPSIKEIHGSKNGNELQGIGIFEFKFFTSGLVPAIFVFAFQNTLQYQIEFLIIATDDFQKRLACKNPAYVSNKRVEIVFWLMQDGSVYNTTNISVEAEWYFLTKGENGRMADTTVMDYTKFLNSWRSLIG